MRRRVLLTALGGATGILAGCRNLREGGYVPDRGCSGDVLDETNIPAARRIIRTWTASSHEGLPDRFAPRTRETPTVALDAARGRVVVRTVTTGDNDEPPRHRGAYARVKRLDYDDETDTLSVVFYSKDCQNGRFPDSTAIEVVVSFPRSLPARVGAEHRSEDGLTGATTVARDGDTFGPDRDCSGGLLGETNVPADRRVIKTYTSPFDDPGWIDARFPPIDRAPRVDITRPPYNIIDERFNFTYPSLSEEDSPDETTPRVTINPRSPRVTVRTRISGDNDASPPDRRALARVTRLHHDARSDDLSVAFASRDCQSDATGPASTTALRVTVSFPNQLPTRVDVEKRDGGMTWTRTVTQ